ncbi:MAG: hypothetical protein M3R00_03260, partial [Pseudomonadota bacterium]|nr:hypothetical protein [Pseudomonadota bacterium]
MHNQKLDHISSLQIIMTMIDGYKNAPKVPSDTLNCRDEINAAKDKLNKLYSKALNDPQSDYTTEAIQEILNAYLKA